MIYSFCGENALAICSIIDQPLFIIVQNILAMLGLMTLIVWITQFRSKK